MKKRQIAVIGETCCFCGVCRAVCPAGAVLFSEEIGYFIDAARCVGCARCAGGCRAHAISLEECK